jgi:small-conductance mechanosensitive channel
MQQPTPTPSAPAPTSALPADSPPQSLIDSARTWLETHVLTLDNAIAQGLQVGVITLAFVLAGMLAKRLQPMILGGLGRLPDFVAPQVTAGLEALVRQGLRPGLWIGLLWAGQAGLVAAGREAALLTVAASLATAWLAIRLLGLFVTEPTLKKLLSWLAWIAAGLSAVGVLDDVIGWLNRTGIQFGDRLVTLPFVLQAIAMTVMFLWAANWLSGQMQRRIAELPKVEPSLRMLITNGVRVGLFVAAFLMVMTGLGIDLSALAILGGALGVGLGFGMQQIVANFVSGIILLTDRSIKPDDVIEVDGTFGVVKSLGLRYASVVTRDGKEYLIPNEKLVTDQVINWSYSDNRVRIKRALRIEYETDLRSAMAWALEATRTVPRVLTDPPPEVVVLNFGEDAIDLEVRFWINDPQQGVGNIRSEVALAVWDRFKLEGVDVPLSRQEVLLEPGSVVDVRIVQG